MMKLSERMRVACKETPWTIAHALVLDLAGEVAQLEEENEVLLSYKEEVEAVADTMYQYTMRRLAEQRKRIRVSI